MAVSFGEIRGFNYSGSWGTSGLDLWQHHDHGTMAVELARGKKHFPGWNTARWWLSHEAYHRDPERFLANFDAGLELFFSHGIAVMPVLFNRWHDPVCDFGGVPLEYILVGSSFSCGPEEFQAVERQGMSEHSAQKIFGDYLRAVVGRHGADHRIFAWDLCNEPLAAPYIDDPESPIRQGELRWLGWCREACLSLGASQPLTIGNYAHPTALEITEPLVDFISFHPYYIPMDPSTSSDLDDLLASLGTKEGFEAFLDSVVELGDRSGKAVLASETVWGAVDDLERAELIHYTLGQLGSRKIGFIAHALSHSLVADLHSSGYGPVTWPGRLEFIDADGSLRQGHEAFNDY